MTFFEKKTNMKTLDRSCSPLSLPNLLTLSRILVSPLLFMGIVFKSSIGLIPIGMLFFYACITDYLDGYLAHITNKKTALGALLDPLADKILIIMVLVGFSSQQMITGLHLIPVGIIVFREILLLGLRGFSPETQKKLSVVPLAKWKTAFQMMALGLLLGWVPFAIEIGQVLLWVSAFLSLWTGIIYSRKMLQSRNDILTP